MTLIQLKPPAIPTDTTIAIISKSDFQKWPIALVAGGGWFAALIAKATFLNTYC